MPKMNQNKMISLDKPHLIFRNQQDLAIHFITPFLSLHRKSISRKIQNPKFPQYMSLQNNNKLGKGYSLHQSKAHYGSFKQKREKTKC